MIRIRSKHQFLSETMLQIEAQLYTLDLIPIYTMQLTLANPTMLANALLTVKTATAAAQQPTQTCMGVAVSSHMLRAWGGFQR